MPYAGAGAATWLATWPLPGRNHLVHPWFSQTRYLLALPELDTRLAASSARHADALAGHCTPLPELHQAALPQLACAQLLPPSLQLKGQRPTSRASTSRRPPVTHLAARH